MIDVVVNYHLRDGVLLFKNGTNEELTQIFDILELTTRESLHAGVQIVESFTSLKEKRLAAQVLNMWASVDLLGLSEMVEIHRNNISEEQAYYIFNEDHPHQDILKLNLRLSGDKIFIKTPSDDEFKELSARRKILNSAGSVEVVVRRKGKNFAFLNNSDEPLMFFKLPAKLDTSKLIFDQKEEAWVGGLSFRPNTKKDMQTKFARALVKRIERYDDLIIWFTAAQ